MSVEELYAVLEGDYTGTMARLMKEDRIKKYLGKFIDATDYSEFLGNVEKENWPEAFRNIHTLKGVCLNLGLSKLADVSSAMTESIRNGAPTEDVTGLIEDVKTEYQRTIEILKENLL